MSGEEIQAALRSLPAEEPEPAKDWPEHNHNAASWIEGGQVWVLELQPYETEASSGGGDLEKMHQPGSVKKMKLGNRAKGVAVSDCQHLSDEVETSPLVSQQTKKTFTSDGEAFSKSSNLRTNQKNLAKALHVCDQCGKEFRWPSDLARHQRVHVRGKAARRDQSQSQASSPFALIPLQVDANSCKTLSQKPVTNQSTHTKNLHNCDQCGKEFRWPSDLARHKRVHAGAKAAKQVPCQSEASSPSPLMPATMALQAENSSEIFSPKSMLPANQRTYRKNLHTSDQRGKDFQWPSALVQHRLVHSGRRVARGDQCQSKLDASNSLTPSPTSLQVCSTDTNCHKAFGTSSQLVTHQHTHLKKSYTCGKCGKSYKWPSNLARHKRTHYRRKFKTDKNTHFKKSYICGQCGKSFQWLSHLTRHEHSHLRRKLKIDQGTDSEKPFVCSQCGKGFLWPSHLAQHKLNHLRGKQQIRTPIPNSSTTDQSTNTHKAFLCDQCGQGFLCLSDLTQHVFAHSGERPYSCAICGCQFRRRVQLIKHHKSHEESDEEEEEDQSECEEDVPVKNTPTKQLLSLSPMDSGEQSKSFASLKACECGMCHTKANDISELLPPNNIWENEVSGLSRPLSLTRPCECGYCGSDDDINTQLTEPLLPNYDITASAEFTAVLSSCEAVTTKPMLPSTSRGARKRVARRLRKKASNESITHFVGQPFAVASQSPKGPKSLSTPSSPLVRHDKPYACPKCPKRFSLASYMTKHLHIHQMGEPYKCTTCGKSFAQRSYLAKHQRVHTTRLAHECPECGSFFTQLSYLCKHMLTHRK
ncbi:zinc finger protein ZFP2-like isoform X2 [Rhineura floridana]|uniref:zinc finger protein ZFP2-like isoform X2 n=1 Tax=Rhineura floridana TaxID=261503 RepID=UPI002AC8677C|nr:zinc finger protein ZFP2-like isoform X2 [Rhineura floridana]